ncbi:jacalin-related lectin 19-like [Typha latifolia]|uniref:jacalin-related lectin 19-like n=1 Tax=Typha latifolia TaxID=4733 RepID=UPI003C2AC9F8
MDLLEQSQKKIIASSKTVKVRSRGGNGGRSTWDDGSHNGARELTTTYGKCIDSIVIEYHQYGKPGTKEHWDIKGDDTIKIELKCPNEFLTTVEVSTMPP